MPSKRYFLVYNRHSLADAKSSNGELPLSTEQTSKLYTSFLVDTVHRFSGVVEARIKIITRNEADLPVIKEHLPNFEAVAYDGETDGDVIAEAADDVFNAGAKQLFLLDSSAPTAPARIVQSGFSLLEVFDTTFTIAPTEGGGFYAVGMNSPHINVLRGGDALSVDGYEEMISRICQLDASVYILNSWYTVLDFNGLIQLRGEVLNSDSYDSMLDRTRELLETIPEENFFPATEKSAKS